VHARRVDGSTIVDSVPRRVPGKNNLSIPASKWSNAMLIGAAIHAHHSIQTGTHFCVNWLRDKWSRKIKDRTCVNLQKRKTGFEQDSIGARIHERGCPIFAPRMIPSGTWTRKIAMA
jgi:hypothetical protein